MLMEAMMRQMKALMLHEHDYICVWVLFSFHPLDMLWPLDMRKAFRIKLNLSAIDSNE